MSGWQAGVTPHADSSVKNTSTPATGPLPLIAPGSSAGSRTAWILSYTGVSNEPRVIRQARSLVRRGWRVVVAGYEGHSPLPPEWHFLKLDRFVAPGALHHRAMRVAARFAGRTLYTRASSSPRAAQAGARLYYRGLTAWNEHHNRIVAALRAHPELAPDLVVAHDYHTCPPANEIAVLSGAAFVVDCHEYAREENSGDPAWMANGRHFASALQDDYLARADAVTTVGQGIADLLDSEQRLRRPVVTIRSLPFFEPQPFRPVSDKIGVLYHGAFGRGRGLLELVRSVHLWQPRFHLILRGSGEEDVVDALRRAAAETGVADRVRIVPPVAFADIITAANASDIGYFAQPGVSNQQRLALPNKLFEYIMAGLALTVGDLPEMRRVVESYGLGQVVANLEPETIAGAINALEASAIDACKRASLVAARELNWEAEERIMLSLFDDVVKSARYRC